MTDGPINFTHETCVPVVAIGGYTGTLVQSPYHLGNNGSGRTFYYVEITAAPEGAEQLIGQRIFIWVDGDQLQSDDTNDHDAPLGARVSASIGHDE